MYTDARHSGVDIAHEKLANSEKPFSTIDFAIREAREVLGSHSAGQPKLQFVPLSPLEKGFFLGVEGGKIDQHAIRELFDVIAANDEKRTLSWITNQVPPPTNAKRIREQLLKVLPQHLTSAHISYLQSPRYNYFEDLKEQYKFYLAGKSSGKYQLVQSGEEINSYKPEKTCSPVVFTIEGIHSLGIGNPDDDFTKAESSKDISIGRVKSRIRQLKGEECLDDSGLSRWQHPPLMVRAASHFGNGVFGHALSFSDCARTVLDQRKYLNKGVLNAGGYEIICELLGLDEQLQPTGSRRILIDMACMSASTRNDLYQKIFRPFNKNISSDHPIPIVFTDAAYSGVDYLAEMIKNANEGLESDHFKVQNYNAGSINVSDEDVLEVFRSRGLISLTLDPARMGNESGGLERLLPNAPRAQAVRLLTRQIAGIISVPFAYNLTSPLQIWDTINIGGGLTGKYRMERYQCSSYQKNLEEDLEEALIRLKKTEPMWFGSFKPHDLVRRICYQNISDFTMRNF